MRTILPRRFDLAIIKIRGNIFKFCNWLIIRNTTAKFHTRQGHSGLLQKWLISEVQLRVLGKI